MKRVLSALGRKGRDWIGAGYGALHAFVEWRERHELALLLFEVTVAITGTIRFAQETLPHLHLRFTGAWLTEIADYAQENVRELFEVVILMLLSLSLTARLATGYRRAHRGPVFPRWRGWWWRSRLDDLFLRLDALTPDAGIVGAPIAADAGDRDVVVTKIALDSSATYSDRSLGRPDREWAHGERSYLLQWLGRFPSAIWRVPPDGVAGATAGGGSGYHSIIVPITPDSYRMIERGHLKTPLVTLDPAGGGDCLHLLAYGTVYVASSDPDERYDADWLIYAAIEHLAHLFATRWPEMLREPPPRALRIICESSNPTLNETLERLGFLPVEEVEERVTPTRSASGFALYELVRPEGFREERDLFARIATLAARFTPPQADALPEPATATPASPSDPRPAA